MRQFFGEVGLDKWDFWRSEFGEKKVEKWDWRSFFGEVRHYQLIDRLSDNHFDRSVTARKRDVVKSERHQNKPKLYQRKKNYF